MARATGPPLPDGRPANCGERAWRASNRRTRRSSGSIQVWKLVTAWLANVACRWRPAISARHRWPHDLTERSYATVKRNPRTTQ